MKQIAESANNTEDKINARLGFALCGVSFN